MQQHIPDTSASGDTSYSTHALDLAHCGFIDWMGLWDVVDAITASTTYRHAMVSLVNIVRHSTIPLPSEVKTRL